MIKTTSDVDLIKTLDDPSLVCRAELFNNTPPEWQVAIIAAGCRFDFQDGTNQLYPAHAIYVTSGQSVYFISNDNCVAHVLIAAAVKVPNQPVQNLSGDEDAPDPDHCLIRAPFVLGPRQRALKSADRAKKNLAAIVKELVIKVG